MQISFLEYKLSINGSIRRVIELANRLTYRGHQVTIYAIDPTPPEWLPCVAPLKPLGDFGQDRHQSVIFNWLTADFYDLIDQTPAAVKAFYLLGMPDKADLPTLRESLTERQGSERDMLFYDVLHNPGIVTMGNGSWMVDWLRAEIGIEVEAAVGGVNLDMFRPVTVATRADRFNVLTSGDPRTHKGFDTVRAAVSLANRTSPQPIHLSTYWGQNIAQADMAATISAADLFVDGQTRAGWNNPVAEAMACGVPVVCTDIGGVRDFARHNETALVVPVGDTEAMAAAVVKMLRSPHDRRRLAAAALETIQGFDYDETTAKVEAILEARL